MERDETARLVGQLREGRLSALAEVYDAWRPSLYSYVVRMTGRPEVGEDLVQETFVRLASAAPRLAEDTRLDAWLFTVARNLLVSHWRKERRIDPWQEPGADATGDRPATDRVLAGGMRPQPTPFEQLAACETHRTLERGLASLPPAYREALLLVGVEGMAPTEAAGVVGVSAEAFRQRLHRARETLRYAMDAEEDA